MEWYYYIGLGIIFYLSVFGIVRILVKIRKYQTKDPYRSEYYGR